MYRHLERRLNAANQRLSAHAPTSWTLPKIVIEQPPKVELGEYALPLAFELGQESYARHRARLRRKLSLASARSRASKSLELAGAGYINARVNRAEVGASIWPTTQRPDAEVCLGQSSGRALEHQSQQGRAHRPSAQRHSRRYLRSLAALLPAGKWMFRTTSTTPASRWRMSSWDSCTSRRNLKPKLNNSLSQPRFDYYCWDLYARVSQWYEQDKQNLQVRSQTLHAIEQGGNETAEIAESDFDRRSSPPSRNHGPAGYRIRLSSSRERNSSSAFLGCCLCQAQRKWRALFSRMRARTKAAG